MNLLEGIKVPSSSALVVPAGACIVGGIVGGLIMKKAIAAAGPVDTLPEKWTKVGEISELNIYPIKGMPGISVQEAALGKLGLKGVENPLLRDRVFLIMNEKGQACSQTKFPMLALTRVNVVGNKVHLSHVKDPSLEMSFDIPTSEGSIVKGTVMGENITGADCGDQVAAWLNRLTETPGMRMIYHVEEDGQRFSVKRNSRFHTYRGTHTGTFQDETSYMLMTAESLAAVNAQMEKPVSNRNFRPTIALSGTSEAFAEDFWGYIRFGDKKNGPVMKASMPCVRCKMTTVDPETGTFRTDGEPLRALHKLKRPIQDAKITRLTSKSPILGAHFGMFDGEGNIVRVGDPVFAALL